MSLKREDLLKEMKESIGTKNPIEFFENMVSVFNLLFDRIEQMEESLHRVKVYSALSIQWEPRVALDMIAEQIEILRQDKETYFSELSALKKAYAEDSVTQNYQAFCQFWQITLGWHPFLDYTK
jgi:hypothetical protein